MEKNTLSSIFLKVQRFDNGDLGQSSGLWASSLAQNTDTALLWRLGMDILIKKLLNYYLSMRQHCTRCEWVCPGVWLDVCATMFRVDWGLRPGLALDCHRQPRQWPLRPLLPGAITGHLWQPCHGNEGANWQTRHYTTAWWFMIDISIHRTLQYMYMIEIEKSPCKTAAYVLLSISVMAW